MRRNASTWLKQWLCRIGWHQHIGLTIGGFIRCYACSRNLHPQDDQWRREFPPDLRPTHVAEADELRGALEDLALACWNDDYTPESQFSHAQRALGYRLEDGVWMRP